MTITNAFPTSFKSELFSGAHCFATTVTPTGSSSTSTSYTSVSSMAGISVGMPFTGTNVGAGSVVAAITSTTAFTSSVASTGSISGGTLTFTGDVFKMALMKNSVSGTYGNTSINYSDITGNSDEASGAGYTATGQVLTNVGPSIPSGITATVSFSPNPSWTSASFSTDGCMIYNTADKLAGIANRCVGVWSFGSTQTVSAGTLTILLPSNTSAAAVLRLA
jgi:hypothetical protein